MELEIEKVYRSSDFSKEYVQLKVLKDTNLKDYAICDNTYDENGKISNHFRHFYEFPSYLVKNGQTVRLYSGTGLPKLDDIINTVFVFWGINMSVWNKTGDVIHLFKISERVNKKLVPEKKS